MNKRVWIWMLHGYAVLLFLIAASYFSYYYYVGIRWGLRDGAAGLLVSDGPLLLLIPTAVAVFMRHPSGWWMHMVFFSYLLIGKLIGIAANLFLLSTGLIVDTEGGTNYLVEVNYMLLYAAALILFSLKPVKNQFRLPEGRKRMFFPFWVGGTALLLYAVHLTVIYVYFHFI
ncbi:MAG: hypothetical protein EA344_07565 [Alkalicoccus sp.]|nr:MAG: hypothetical protein EA344_07565 [Alkalicoccus sp.]